MDTGRTYPFHNLNIQPYNLEEQIFFFFLQSLDLAEHQISTDTRNDLI